MGNESIQEYLPIGQISNDKVPEYMGASDVLVLPSLSEGFSLVVLEAMASGLTIVASKVGGLPELIEDGKNGFLVAPKDAKALADRILALLDNEELRQDMVMNNRNKVQRYSWESTVSQLEEVYRHVLAKIKVTP
jgi:glycosyltransferase involved in cell wall biosynthesis